MKSQVFVFDPTAGDKLSKVRGIGRYLQILKENFPDWNYTSNLYDVKNFTNFKDSIFINPFFNFLQSPLTMKRVAEKQIAVIHDLIPLKYPEHFPAGLRGGLNIFLNKLALKNYDLIITDSEASKKDIVRLLGINENTVKVVYPCLSQNLTKYSVSSIQYSGKKQKISDTQSIQNTEYSIPNTDYCLYVGDATWNKNLVNLAKAIKIADVQCVFVGKVFENLASSIQYSVSSINKADIEYSIPNTEYSSNPWLREFTEFMQITKGDTRFIFKGFVKDYELVKFYQQAKVNLLLSRDEGFGFSYLEAASFGCPSILSNTPILKEISTGKGATFAPHDNPNIIAERVKQMFINENLRQKLSSEALERSRYFNYQSFKKEFSNVI